MYVSGTHAAQLERDRRGYQWFWSLQHELHPQPIPGSVNTTIITRQEQPWHPRSILGSSVFEPSAVITFKDFSFHPPYSAIGLRLGATTGATLTSGMKGYLPIRFRGNIVRMMLVANAVGSAVLDIYKVPLSSMLAGDVPGPNDSIMREATFRPTLNNAQTAYDATLYFWETALAPGDLLAFNVVSVSGINSLTLTLFIAVKD